MRTETECSCICGNTCQCPFLNLYENNCSQDSECSQHLTSFETPTHRPDLPPAPHNNPLYHIHFPIYLPPLSHSQGAESNSSDILAQKHLVMLSLSLQLDSLPASPRAFLVMAMTCASPKAILTGRSTASLLSSCDLLMP